MGPFKIRYCQFHVFCIKQRVKMGVAKAMKDSGNCGITVIPKHENLKAHKKPKATPNRGTITGPCRIQYSP